MSCMISHYSSSYAPHLSCSLMHLRGRRVASPYLRYNPNIACTIAGASFATPGHTELDLSCVTSTAGSTCLWRAYAFLQSSLLSDSLTDDGAATLEHSPGTTVETFVTFLTTIQLKRMHETEGAYYLNELTNLDLHVGLSLEAFRWDPFFLPLSFKSGMLLLPLF